MIKRLCSRAIWLLLLLNILPLGALATAGGYTLSVLENKSVSNGSDVTITLDLSNSSAFSYNAFDISMTYDATRLEYKSCTLPSSQVQHTSGNIRLVGYGEDKVKSMPLAVVSFKAIKTGTAVVQVTSAQIDRSSNAIVHDAPQAGYSPKMATISVLPTYTVTLSEGLTADLLEVVDGQSYTFTATDYANYTYSITAKAGTQTITVTDNKDGTFTIPGTLVKGDITVQATKTPKSYDVTITGEDVTGEKKASYNTDYTFKLTSKTGYNYTVKVTIGGTTYACTPSSGVYTIKGTDITGDIAITVTKTKKTTTTNTSSTSTKTTSSTAAGNLKVEISGSGYSDTAGSPYTKKGTTYGFRIKEEAGYRYEISVQVDGKPVDYTYDEKRTLYQIPGEMITGNVTIVVNKQLDVRVSEYLTLNGRSIYLILVPDAFGKKQVPKYDGQTMYYSPVYPGYCWLYETSESTAAIEKQALEKVAIADGKREASADCSGNVNLSTEIDINDAQMVYEMYTTLYRQEDLSSVEFLGADVNGDQKVNVLDVMWILNDIHSRTKGGAG